MEIAIVGDGAWGSALAIHFANKHPTTLLSRSAEEAMRLKIDQENKRFLPGFKFPRRLNIADLSKLSLQKSINLFILATPVSGLRAALNNLGHFRESFYLVASKGLESGTGLLPHQVVADVFPGHTKMGLFSGPTFAQEVAAGLPAAISLSGDNFSWAKELAQILNDQNLRIYANNDPIGTGIGGAVKNILAIACGFCDGKKAGSNARAALITRGLAEMRRFAFALGAAEETLMGLSGVGDLILTCTGNLSRNRQLGLKLAEGKPLNQILQEIGHVTEGLNTLKQVLITARSLGVEMPIAQMLAQVLQGTIKSEEVINALMQREPKEETVY